MGKTSTATVENAVYDRCGDIEIKYVAKPRRFYEVRALAEVEAGHGPWVEVPSVSTIVDCLSKNGLSWWGQTTALEAVVKLFKIGGFITPDQSGDLVCWDADLNRYVKATAESLNALLTKQKLTVNHVLKKAGDRGTGVHDAYQNWIEQGLMPQPSLFVPEEQGYVEGLVKFLTALEANGKMTKRRAEVMVGSVEHKFAGRFDCEGDIKNAELCVKLPTPSWKAEGPNHHSAKGPEFKVFNGLTLFDLKTSKGIYDSHLFQMEGYEIGRVEGGLPPTEQRLVVNVRMDGSYVVGESNGKAEDFLDIRKLYDTVTRIGLA